MDKLQALVREFHIRVAKQPHSPAPPELRVPELRALLHLEEAIESAHALVGVRAQALVQVALLRVINKLAKQKWDGQPRVLDAIQETVDMLVVGYGTLECIGVDGEPYATEVMRANMAKEGGPVDENGKLLKPEGWQPPDLRSIFEREGK